MYDVQNARKRDGDKAEDRSDRVDEILNRPRLGYQESDPLPESFEDYDAEGWPEQPDDLTTPEAREFVTELFAHDKVNSVRDAVEETTPATGDPTIVQKWAEAFERAAEVFGVELPESDDETEQRRADSRLAELVGDTFPEDMWDPSNPLVVSALYGGFGLSCDEIADVFNDESETRVKPERVRGVLRSAGLIRATESEDSEPSHKLGGASFELSDDPSPSGTTGVNIDTEAVARDPHISVERNEQ